LGFGFSICRPPANDPLPTTLNPLASTRDPYIGRTHTYRLNYNLILENHEDGTVSGVIRAEEFVEEGGEIAFTGTQDGRRLRLNFEDNVYLDRFVGRVVPSGWYVHGEMRSDDGEEITGWSRFRELRFANDHNDLDDDRGSESVGKKKTNDNLFNSNRRITD
jgi:hypothetical protein